MAYNMQCCALALLCEDRKGDEYKLSWGWMSIVVVFTVFRIGLSFIYTTEDTYIRLVWAFFVIPVMQYVLSSATLFNECAYACMSFKELF